MFFACLAGYIDAEGYFRAYYVHNQPKPLAASKCGRMTLFC